MTIADVTPEIAHVGNGVANTYTYPFRIFQATDMVVTIDGVSQIYGVDYTLTGIGSASGDVVFAAPPANLAALLFRRAVPYNRTTDFQEAGDFLAQAVNRELDRVVALIQQIRTAGIIALHYPAGDTRSAELPAAADRALKRPAFDASGNVIVTEAPATDDEVPVTPFMETLLDDPSASIARQTLGVPDAVAKGDIATAQAAGPFTRKAVGADGSALIADSRQLDGLLWLPQYPKSLAPNAFFEVDQRVTSGVNRADATYAQDRWYVLCQGTPVVAQTLFEQENGMATSARLNNPGPGATRMGQACIIESADAIPLRGKRVTFRPRVKVSATATVRYAIIEWTGSADFAPRELVNDWTNASFTPGNFFVGANLNVAGTGNLTPVNGVWTDAPGITVDLGATLNNLYLFVWTETAIAAPGELHLGKMRFVLGDYAGEIEIPKFAETLRYCMRYYEKSFPYAVQPAQSASQTGAHAAQVQVVGASATMAIIVKYQVRKRVNGAYTQYNPVAANALWRNVTVGADSSANSSTPTLDGAICQITTPGGSAAGNRLECHWTCDSDF